MTKRPEMWDQKAYSQITQDYLQALAPHRVCPAGLEIAEDL